MEVMPWLADTDVGAAYGFARAIVGARTEVELRSRALRALAELVPADLVTWDRIELATANDARWVQSVAVIPNTRYRFCGWVKTLAVADSADGVNALLQVVGEARCPEQRPTK